MVPEVDRVWQASGINLCMTHGDARKLGKTTIVLISCASKKLPHKARAEDLYISPLFKLSLRYARSLDPDAIFILSAKHGLVGLEQELDCYNCTLNEMSTRRVKQWGDRVLGQLRGVADLDHDRIVFLAGERYRKHLLPHVRHPEVPLRGLGIGKQMKFLKERLPDE